MMRDAREWRRSSSRFSGTLCRGIHVLFRDSSGLRPESPHALLLNQFLSLRIGLFQGKVRIYDFGQLLMELALGLGAFSERKLVNDIRLSWRNNRDDIRTLLKGGYFDVAVSHVRPPPHHA